MAVGNYLSTRSKIEYEERERKRQYKEIQDFPELKTYEIRNIYAQKGFKEELLEKVTNIIIANRKVWTDILLREKTGVIDKENVNPVFKAITTFVAFHLVGLIPLLPFIFTLVINNPLDLSSQTIFAYSSIFTALSFFSIGFISGKVVDKPRIRSGFITLIIGGIAALVSFVVGTLLSTYIL